MHLYSLGKSDKRCSWSTWKAVGECSTNCGKGVQTYTRYRYDSVKYSSHYSCHAKTVKTKTCYSYRCRGTFYT